MIENGIRVSILPNSRKYNTLRNQQGTVVGSLGYGDYAVQFDNTFPFGNIFHGWDETLNRRIQYTNCLFVNRNSFKIIEVDVGDLEDDL